jgi:hypothetical protein
MDNINRTYHKGYMGITHIEYFILRNNFPLFRNFLLKLWKRFLCGKGVHLFDECESYHCCGDGRKQNGDIDHYLSCDACNLMIHIDEIETTWVDK